MDANREAAQPPPSSPSQTIHVAPRGGLEPPSPASRTGVVSRWTIEAWWTEQASTLRQGADGEFDVGAIFWDRQLEIIERHVEDAKQRGARVLVGGRRNPNLPGLFYEPTVLTDVDHEMDIMRFETFGPVLCIMRVRDEAEAIRLANDSPYGLAGTVWSKDKNRALEIAQQVETGSICVNDMALTTSS